MIFTPGFSNKKGQNTMQSYAEIDALFEEAARSTPDTVNDYTLLKIIGKKVTSKDCIPLLAERITHEFNEANEICQQAEKDPSFSLRKGNSKASI